jgi:hypothetical protein
LLAFHPFRLAQIGAQDHAEPTGVEGEIKADRSI